MIFQQILKSIFGDTSGGGVSTNRNRLRDPYIELSVKYLEIYTMSAAAQQRILLTDVGKAAKEVANKLVPTFSLHDLLEYGDPKDIGQAASLSELIVKTMLEINTADSKRAACSFACVVVACRHRLGVYGKTSTDIETARIVAEHVFMGEVRASL